MGKLCELCMFCTKIGNSVLTFDAAIGHDVIPLIVAPEIVIVGGRPLASSPHPSKKKPTFLRSARSEVNVSMTKVVGTVEHANISIGSSS